MIIGPEVILLHHDIWLQADLQPTFSAKITAIENGLFWINLPRDSNQILVLFKNQKVKVGVPHPKGFYQAETIVGELGEVKDKFYGLVIPQVFEASQERRFSRAHHYTNVVFTTGTKKVQTALVNFSAGGIMVYLVPELEDMIATAQDSKVTLTIDQHPFEVDVKLAWKKQYDHIPFAGFQFENISPRLQSALAMLSTRYAQK